MFAEDIKGESGFTLLEVLLAMTLFSIVVSVIYGSYSATFRTANQLESRIGINNKARIVMERLVEDLESLYLGYDGFIKGESEDGQGVRADTLQFTSTAHLVFNKNQQPASYATIGYRVEAADDGLLNLYRSDNPYRPMDNDGVEAEGGDYLLCDGLKSVQFTYVNQENDEVDDWDSEVDDDSDEGKTKRVPKMIQFTLIFVHQPESEDTQVFKTGVALPVMNVAASL